MNLEFIGGVKMKTKISPIDLFLVSKQLADSQEIQWCSRVHMEALKCVR